MSSSTTALALQVTFPSFLTPAEVNHMVSVSRDHLERSEVWQHKAAGCRRKCTLRVAFLLQCVIGAASRCHFVACHAALRTAGCQAQLCFTHTLRFFGAGRAHSLRPAVLPASLPRCWWGRGRRPSRMCAPAMASGRSRTRSPSASRWGRVRMLPGRCLH